MSMSRKYDYNGETGETTVEVFYKGQKSVGKARLHPDDMDFKNLLTGAAIAEYRAQQKAHHKVCVELKDKLRKANALVAELERQLAQHEDAMKEIQITEEEFISKKDKFYQSVRDLRNPQKQLEREGRMAALRSMMGDSQKEVLIEDKAE